MALFEATYDTDEDFAIHQVVSGNAVEMVDKLAAVLVAADAAGEEAIVDFKLSGAGSGPQWLAEIVTATTVAAGVVQASVETSRFVAAVAGNPTQVSEAIRAALTAANAGTVYKIEVAGAGDGPTYMAVALYAPGVS